MPVSKGRRYRGGRMGRDRLAAALLMSWLTAATPAHAEPAAPTPAPAAPKPAAPAAAKAKAAPAAAIAPKVAAPAPGSVDPLALDVAAVRKLLSGVPALAPLADDFTLFEAADTDAALRRGGRSQSSITVWAFQPSAFSWKPSPDRELWVLTGRSGKHALLAVFERRADGTTEHAASAIFDEPDATIAVGFGATTPGELLWTTCYACRGEGGAIRLLPDRRVDIAFR